MTISQWRSCEIGTMDKELLRLIIQLVKQHVDQWGSYPTPEQLQTLIVTGR